MKKAVEQNLKKERIQHQKEKKYQESILILHKSNNIQKFYKKYNNLFDYIFDYYYKNIKIDVDVLFNTRLLQYKGFMTFAA